MPVDRPTFSESWYRVAELKPRLRSTVQVHRQHFRGRMWHVLQDPSSNQFFRLNDAAYHFVAMLDGRRNVADVWRTCSGELGDSAPTQGEAIQLLGQLYTSNLLHAELPPDAQGLFNRYQKRVRREVQGYLTNFLFIRVPLLDPDNFLNAWVSVVGWMYSWVGFVLWLAVVSTGLYFVLGRMGELADRASSILDMENLPFLYLSFIGVKVFHEFSHAFACKTLGQRSGTGGEVHVMGIMFLVFTPMPYVDASSAWALRSKRHRALVGAAGMLMELVIASIAAVIWAHTGDGTVHAICYNVMFIASVSSLLFNGNPLLRYDAYYILSDLVEIPNLAQRSKNYIYYVVKKYVWNVRQARNPAHTRGEKAWFVFYGIASTIYRVFILVRILLFVASKLFMVGVVLAVAAAIAWGMVPLFKFIKYLATSGELLRVRFRAVSTTVLAVGLVVSGLTLLPAPDRFRLEGIVEPVRIQVVHAGADGFVQSVLASGQIVSPDGNCLLVARSRDLEAERDQVAAEKRRIAARRSLAQAQGDVASAQIFAEQLDALQDRADRVRDELNALNVGADFRGLWISPHIDRAKGAYLRRGDRVGLVASDDLIIRAVAEQDVATMLIQQARADNIRNIEIRVKGLPDLEMKGHITRIIEAGKEDLPSAALGYTVGGSVRTKDPRGAKAQERFFEIYIQPEAVEDTESFWHGRVPLLSGQRVVARVEMPPLDLARQWYRSLLQLVQRRFHI